MEKKDKTRKLQKLTLSRETLHPIEPAELQGLQGGFDAATGSRICGYEITTTRNC